VVGGLEPQHSSMMFSSKGWVPVSVVVVVVVAVVVDVVVLPSAVVDGEAPHR